jgi:tetratricopeptide (TPR) repeat protein
MPEERLRQAYRLHEAGDTAAAGAIYREILRAHPDHVDALFLLGEIENRAGDPAAAIVHLSRAIALEGGIAAFHRELGGALHAAGELEQSARSYRRALELDPRLAAAHVDFAALRLDQGELAQAEAHCHDALRIDPDFVGAHVSLGFSCELRGELAQAMASYERALALEPGNPQIHLNRAALWLLTEDFARGWPEFEWRLKAPEKAAAHGRFALPRWDGAPLAGRSLLVYGEQGLGDEIMYASCIPELLAAGARLAIECEPRLEQLFRRSFPQARVGSQVETAALDLQVAAGSLPLHLRRTPAAFPAHQGYLRADPDKVSRWRARLAGLPPGSKIGLSWRGGVQRTGRAWRSLDLEQLLPVLRQPGAVFVSLQYGDCAEELARLEREHGVVVHHWPQALADYDETAALVAALDRSISVCTAGVHLAGALGRPVWVLAPIRPEARYGWRGEAMRWYPSARVFRQATFGDWAPVIDRAAQALAAELRRA